MFQQDRDFKLRYCRGEHQQLAQKFVSSSLEAESKLHVQDRKGIKGGRLCKSPYKHKCSPTSYLYAHSQQLDILITMQETKDLSSGETELESGLQHMRLMNRYENKNMIGERTSLIFNTVLCSAYPASEIQHLDWSYLQARHKRICLWRK